MKVKSAVFIKSAVKPSDYPAHNYPEIAFAGRSNVGKSSLINCLAQRRALAKTSNTPGRTRLLNFFLINDALVLVDLPGYGFAKVSAQIKREWGEMMETYLAERPNLKAVVLVLDVRREPAEGDFSFVEWLEAKGLKVVIVVTKTDKVSHNQRHTRMAKIQKTWGNFAVEVIPFSSQTKEGRETLWQTLTQIAQ